MDMSSRPGGSRAAVVLAIDIGSSGVRTVAYTSDYRIVAVTSSGLSTTVGADGASTHSWPDVVSAVLAGIAQLAAAPSLDVRAVSLSGTASSLVASIVNASGSRQLLSEIMLWSDTRAASLGEPVADPAMAAETYRRTLCPDHISYWPAKLRWLQSHTRAPGGRPVDFAGAKDLIFELLTGKWWTDTMTAASTGVYDSELWQWDRPLLAAVGVDPGQLPEVRAGTDNAPVTDSLAGRLGLRPGTPIVLGGMDGPLNQIGGAGLTTDLATFTLGTSIAYRAGVGRRTIDPTGRLWCYPVMRDFWVLGGAGSNGGNVLAWLSSTLGRGEDVGAVVGAALALPPDPGLHFLPYLHGERSPLWRDDFRGAIVGLVPHHGATDIARAALDGVAIAALELAQAVTSQVGAPREVRLTGGFLRQSAWAQLITDALGMPTSVPAPEEATCTGAAMLGWASIGAGMPTPPLPARATQRRLPDLAVHDVLQSKAQTVRWLRGALFPRAGVAPVQPEHGAHASMPDHRLRTVQGAAAPVSDWLPTPVSDAAAGGVVVHAADGARHGDG